MSLVTESIRIDIESFPKQLHAHLNELQKPLSSFSSSDKSELQDVTKKILSKAQFLCSIQHKLSDPTYSSRVLKILGKLASQDIPSTAQKASQLKVPPLAIPMSDFSRIHEITQLPIKTIPSVHPILTEHSSGSFLTVDSDQGISKETVRKEPSSPIEFYELNSPNTKKRRFECDDSISSYALPILPTSTPSSFTSDSPTVDMESCTSEAREAIVQLKAVIHELTEIHKLWKSNKIDTDDFDDFIAIATRFNEARKNGSPLIKTLENIPQTKEITNYYLIIYRAINKLYNTCTVEHMRKIFAQAKFLDKNKKTISSTHLDEQSQDLLDDVDQLIKVRKLSKNDVRIKKIREIVEKIQSEIPSREGVQIPGEEHRVSLEEFSFICSSLSSEGPQQKKQRLKE